MFGWDFQNRKSDRIKLFLFLLVIFLIVAFTVSAFYRSMNEENAVAVQQNIEGVEKSSGNDSATISDDQELLAVDEQTNDYDQTENFSEKSLKSPRE